MSRLARLRWALAGVGLTVACAVVWLVVRVVEAQEREERLRHQMVAARVFDELERELTALVLREEERSFLEYRHFYAPEGQLPGSLALVRSPLAELPEEPGLLGWFSIDPDGTVGTPLVPRNPTLAAGNGWSVEPAVEARAQQLIECGAELVEDDEPVQTFQLAQRAPQQQRPARVPAPPAQVEVELNKGAQARAEVVPRVVETQVDNVLNFQSQAWNDEQQNAVYAVRSARARGPVLLQQQPIETVPVERVEPEPLAVEPAPSPSPAPLPDALAATDPLGIFNPVLIPATRDGSVEAELAPFTGVAIDERYLALVRRVSLAGEDYRQGLLLDWPELVSTIGQRVLADTELADSLRLFPPHEVDPASGRFLFSHQFAEPFSGRILVAVMDPLPEASRPATALVVLAGLLLLLLGPALFAIYRMSAVAVAYARRRSEFVAAVSHELKTPLTSIRMYSEMLRDGMVPAEERRQAYYAIMAAESERLSRLIQNVLELARLERGQASPGRKVGQVEPLLREALAVLRPHAEQKGFALELSVEEGLPAVSFEPDGLQQVVINLVDNAIKFAQESEQRTVELSCGRAEEGGLWIRVRDHGPGVPPAMLRRLWEPFFRGERELTRKTRGTGIGLALVAGLTRRMGGRVSARNHPAGGLEVSIALA